MAAPPNPWETLEAIPGLSALPEVWHRLLGGHFSAFRTLCLEPSPTPALGIPCPRHCGCVHSVILRHDHTGAVAICRCDPAACPDIPLTIPQITPFEVNRARLGRALARAFGCESKSANLRIHETMQFGSWSADAVPVILTMQSETHQLVSAIAQLVATLRQKFILFTPTTILTTATSQQLLATVGAAIFDLASTLILTPQGTLQPTKSPGVLFAGFTAQPKEMDEDLGTRVVALVSQFDANTLAVFRLYCIQGMSAAQVARKCRCSKTTVMRRLKTIHEKTGIPAAQMRRISPHLAKLEASISDSRARRINRQALAHDTGQTGDVEP